MIWDKYTRKYLNIYNHIYKIHWKHENQWFMQIFILLYCATINMLTCIYITKVYISTDANLIMIINMLQYKLGWFCNMNYYNCERSRAKRGENEERTSIREARELLFNVLGLEQGVSRKLSIFDIWCIEQKMFVFTWISKVRHKKKSTRPGPTRTWR